MIWLLYGEWTLGRKKQEDESKAVSVIRATCGLGLWQREWMKVIGLAYIIGIELVRLTNGLNVRYEGKREFNHGLQVFTQGYLLR